MKLLTSFCIGGWIGTGTTPAKRQPKKAQAKPTMSSGLYIKAT